MIVMADNTSAITHIRNQGGDTRSLTEQDRHGDPGLVHQDGHSSVWLMNRQGIAATEWTLNMTVFESLWKVWPRPFLDLIATRENTRLPQFVLPVLFCHEPPWLGGVRVSSKHDDINTTREAGSTSDSDTFI